MITENHCSCLTNPLLAFGSFAWWTNGSIEEERGGPSSSNNESQSLIERKHFTGFSDESTVPALNEVTPRDYYRANTRALTAKELALLLADIQREPRVLVGWQVWSIRDYVMK